MKSKLCDKSIQGKKEIVFDQNWKHVEVQNQRTNTPAEVRLCQKKPPGVLYKKLFLNNFKDLQLY